MRATTRGHLVLNRPVPTTPRRISRPWRRTATFHAGNDAVRRSPPPQGGHQPRQGVKSEQVRSAGPPLSVVRQVGQRRSRCRKSQRTDSKTWATDAGHTSTKVRGAENLSHQRRPATLMHGGSPTNARVRSFRIYRRG